MIYFLVIDCVLFYSAWCRPKQSKVLYTTTVIGLWFLMAFRNIDLGGSDAQVYQEWFHTAVPNLLQFEWNPFVFQREIQDEWGFGWLFTLLASITKTIVPTYEFFQVVYVTLSFGILILIIEDMQLKQQEKGLFLFAYLSQQMIWFFCVLLRQNLANLVVWFVLEHKFKKNALIKKALLLYLATLLHTSAYIAIAAIIALWVIRKLPARKIVPGSLLIGVTVFFAGKRLISYILYFMANYVDTRYSMYLNAAGESSNAINFVLRLCFVVLLYLEFTRNREDGSEKNLYIGVIGFLIGSIPQALVVRMTEYFAIANNYAVAKLRKIFKIKENRVIVASIVLIVFFIVFVRFLNVNADFMRNYKFLF